MDVFDLYASIFLKTDDYERSLKSASEQTKDVASAIGSGLKNAASIGGSALKTISSAAGVVVEKVGDVVKTSAKIGTAIAAAGATGVVALTKSSLEAYAEYEQLVGGVETLFGKSADVVQKYAANAYKTAGLSANRYMEIVTSFSASLLQGLGGDTKQAAEMANMAITDMSDNANKMGTSMESIQTAYAGFAKQNYTMLDNLKLGYGGTQAEMKRLIQDAAALTDVQEELGVTVDANSMSFDNIVSAIHVVQKSMGILGTTEKEAATTIQGSVASMKSAWANLKVGIADDTADMDTLITDFVDSVGTAAENIEPRITKILTGIGDAIERLAPVVSSALTRFVTNVLPDFVAAGGNMIAAVVSAIGESGDELWDAGEEAAGVIMDALVDAIETLLPSFGETIGELIPTAVEYITERLPELIPAGVEFVANIVVGILESIPIIVENAPEIIKSFKDAVIEEAPKLLDAGAAAVQSIADGISDNGYLLDDALDSLETMLTDFGGVSEDTADSVTDAFRSAFEEIDEIFTSLENAIDAVVYAVQNCGIDWAEVWDEISETVTIAGGFISAALNALADVIRWISDQMNEEGTFINLCWKNIQVDISTAVGVIQGVLLTLTALLNGDFDEAWRYAKETCGIAWDGISTKSENKMDYIAGKVESGMEAVSSAFESGLSDADSTTTSKFGSIFEKIRSKMQSAYDAVAGVIEKIKAKFNFSWSLPHLKLPHVSISGSFSLNPPSVPRFSIAWYKKAMDIPMILSGATIFGAMGGNLLGGGESGSEIVAGQETLMNMIRDATGAEETNNLLRKLLSTSSATPTQIIVNGSDYSTTMELAQYIAQLINRDTQRRGAALAY